MALERETASSEVMTDRYHTRHDAYSPKLKELQYSEVQDAIERALKPVECLMCGPGSLNIRPGSFHALLFICPRCGEQQSDIQNISLRRVYVV